MKFLILVVAVLVACASASLGGSRQWPPRSTGPTFPRPGQSHRFRRDLTGSLGAVIIPGRRPDPTIQLQGHWRFRREADPQGSISGSVTQPLSGPERRPTINLDYQHRIYEGKQGSISASGGVAKFPGHRVEPNFGIQGQWRFRREANPQGSISGSVTQPLSGPERRPTVNLDYQHKIYEGKQGSISASGGVAKFPGHRVEPTIGIQGQWRFRREANPQGSISGSVTQPLSGPERRPTVNLDYQHRIYEGKQGSISASGGVAKFPGHRAEPNFGIQGQWRFRREANPQGSISGSVTQPLSGPERRPTVNLDYQHRIYEGKQGSISASGGVAKFPGHRAEPNFGIQGQWRFRREANPQGSISGSVTQPLSGPERRPTVNLDYQHRIYEGKQGSISASGGVAKFPGHRVEPTIGIQGQWRFRREANPQGSISGSVTQPLSGPERRPTINLDYQHKIYEGKQGSISASGGVAKFPGHRAEPNFGIQGQWRFRREANPQGSISGSVIKPLSGPERRPTINLDYQHKIYEGKQGSVSASGGVAKFPGHRVEPTIGIQGQWRFRRETDDFEDLLDLLPETKEGRTIVDDSEE